MKWKDRPSVTEMDRGDVYELERQTKCKKNGNSTEMDKVFLDFKTGAIMCY